MVVSIAGPADAARPRPEAGAEAARAGADRPLDGRVVVLDPGHQLGNHNFPRQINRLVPAGGFRKPCNTTGTATNRGYPEATFVWQVVAASSSSGSRRWGRGSCSPDRPTASGGGVRASTSAAGPATRSTPT